MLPLWIIDITGQSDRQAAFQQLVGKIDHVHIPDAIKSELAKLTQNQGNLQNTDSSLDKKDDENLDSATTKTTVAEEVAEGDFPLTGRKTLEEQLEEEEKREAIKNAKLIGDYWYYSVFEDPFRKDLSSEFQQKLDELIAEKDEIRQEKNLEPLNEDEKATFTQAMKLYSFQEEMVKTGADFIYTLRKSNAKPYQSFNIVVLGDTTEEFTRKVFPSIAAMLQKEKGRMLPSHIHQGMSIYGMLYIPCNINTFNVEERKKVLHVLDEVEVQHNISSTRGYDHMMLYQNVQNRTECSYPLLDDKGQAEYLIQCLVHLFLASNINNPVLSGTSSDDTFYFSMGAASVYFDMEAEDESDINNVARNLVLKFKEEGDHEESENREPLLDKKCYEAEIFVKEFSRINDLDELNNDFDMPEFSPHPIINFMHRSLKRLYYHVQLRYFPAALLRKILSKIEDVTAVILDKISDTSNKAFKSAAIAIKPSILRRIAKVTENDGALSYVEFLLKGLQELLSSERSRLKHVLETTFWDTLISSSHIPEDQKGYFIEYHDIYKADISSKNDGAGCATARQEAIKNLQALLSKEKTTLATLGRTFFTSIICVLFFLPVLDLMSPDIIDLGNVKKYSLIWGFVVFLIPLLIQWISYLFYIRKRNRLIRVLRAYYVHDAYARLANRIESEANECYMKLIELAEEYLRRCKRIRHDVSFPSPPFETKMVFPETMFNQPLNGGTFNDEYIIPSKEVECSKIRVNFEPQPVNELTKAHYYLLINYFYDVIGKLFNDVGVIDSHTRRFNESLGDYEFISQNELKEESERKWNSNIVDFKKLLLNGIRGEMIPREYPTVGDKLIQYKKKIDRYDLLEPLMSFAATNGEVISAADPEFADIKVNREINDLSTPYLPLYTTKLQVVKYDKIYEKYIFVTRWRCFEHFSYNRILPTEDFDISEREIVNYVAEKKAKKRKEDKQRSQNQGKAISEIELKGEVEPYEPCLSSLILWATCPDENSGEWLKLFDANHFGEAYKDREKFREILNQND